MTCPLREPCSHSRSFFAPDLTLPHRREQQCAREPSKTGRPPVPLSDAVFSIVFKVYSTVSQRRFVSDLREAHNRGFVTKVPHFNSISNYLENPGLTPVLRELITQSSLPLRSVESDFATDSSGFTTCRFTRWFDHKYGTVKQKHDWVKCHLGACQRL
jgi:hypothetical protein